MKLTYLGVSSLAGRAVAASSDLTGFVDNFIGTQGPAANSSFNGGNVFPGPTLPFGAVKPGIDTTEYNLSTDANAGYTPDGFVTAITMLHESGTGGAPKYGLIPQLPLTTLQGVNVLDNLTYMQGRIGSDTASVGYYKTNLANGVTAELTASQHAGLFKYNYPSSGGKYILVDISHHLPTQDEQAGTQFYSNGQIDVSQDGTMYSGSGTWRGGWNEGPDFTVYFCSIFDTVPSSARLFQGPYVDPYWPNTTGAVPTFVEGRSTSGGTPGWQYANRIGALFEFPNGTTTVNSKTGVSWISVDKACTFLSEIPLYDMDSTVATAKSVWNSQVLNRIQVKDTTNMTRTKMFYSALYRTHLLPSNRTGEQPYWTPTGQYYDDFYTIWDIFRCLTSLYNLMDPDLGAGIVSTLIDIFKNEGFMPDGRSSNYNGRVQGGSNADNVLADAYVKGIGKDSINWTEGYAAMLKDAEFTPYNNFDMEDLTQSTKEGRGALPDWLAYGYVTPNFGRSISKTVEYSLNDFALSQVAKGEAPQDVNKYLNRSAGWQKTWRQNVTSLGYSGFLAPTYGNGTIQPYDPLSCGGCEWTSITYEGLPWEYSWTIPHDMETLISLMGGPNTTESRLDTMFKPGLRTGAVGVGGNNGQGTTLFNPGNEPSFGTPFLYNYLQGRQHKSVLRSRQTVDTYYTDQPGGLPGNSDAGATDSWLLWNLMGMYPIVTQPVYLLLSPWFDDIAMDLSGGKSLHITADGLSESSFYVQSVTVNGIPWNQSWVSHEDLTVGNATIHFVLGAQPVSWDTGTVPPSPGHVTL